MAYADGTFTAVKQDGLTRVTYPFLNAQSKDTTTKQYEADYLILPASYTPASALATWPGDGGTIASDANAYLVEETDPDGSSGAYRVKRRYSKIPSQQTMYSSRTFARPNFSGMKSGSTYAASLDSGRSVHLWTSRKAVQSVTNNQGGSTSNALPSGTVTITLSDASSCNFAANATKATIDAALAGIVAASPNKLLSAYSTVASDGSTVTIWYSRHPGGPSVSSVTGPSTVDITQLTGQISYKAVGTTITPDTKTMRCDSHGASTGSRCAIWNGDSLASVGQVSGVGDANTLTLVMSDLSSPEVNITHLTFDAGAAYRYNLEPAEVMSKEVWDFYLPGVSGGITTGADVAMPTVYQSAQSFFDRIVAADTYTAIAANLEQWQGPILVRKTISVKMSSALQSMSVT